MLGQSSPLPLPHFGDAAITERMKLYNKLSSFINRKLPNERKSHRQTFAMFVFGLLVGQRVHLPRICSQLPLRGKQESFQMRLHRFLKLTSIDNQILKYLLAFQKRHYKDHKKGRKSLIGLFWNT